jgi:hypothetical protein
VAILRAAATASFTLDNTGTPVLITGLTLTPASGEYLLFATVETENASSGGSESNDFSVYVGGSIIAHTERNIQEETSLDADRITVQLHAEVNPNGSQAVEIRHTASSSLSPQTAFRREMTLFPAPAAGTTYEQTGTSNQTRTSSTYATLNNMAVTPAADDYLLVFGCQYETTADDDVGFRVSVGGTPIAHTVREAANENSLANTPRSIGLACQVSPNGSQEVAIEWRNVPGSGTVDVDERSMQLVPVDSADIVQATGTADDSRSTTGEILIDDMTIADPGDDDWLVIFTSFDSVGSIGNLIQTTYSIREGGTKVTDSDRRNDHEGSSDLTAHPVVAGGRVTIGGATDDLQAYWDVDSSSTWTLHERTLVAIREASAQVFNAAIAGSMGMRPVAEGAKTYTGIGHYRLPSRSLTAAAKTATQVARASIPARGTNGSQKTAAGISVARVPLRARSDGIRAFIAAIVARLSLRGQSDYDKAAAGIARDSLALRSSDATTKISAGNGHASLALRAADIGAKTYTGVAVERFALRPFSTGQKTFDAVGVASFALSSQTAAQKVAVGIGAESFAIRVTADGQAIFAAGFPYHVIKENDRDMRGMLTL